MANPCWWFLETGARTGAFNMALDEALARQLAEPGMPMPGRTPVPLDGQEPLPTLRLFRWEPWAISVGYNQGTDELDAEKCKRDGIDIVRRPTGGRAILHAEELTYSIVMPAGRRSVLQVYNDISRALVRGLHLFGVDASLQRSQPHFPGVYRHPSSIPCFTRSSRYEIEWSGRKLVGSAQRRFAGGGRDVVLQHGSILCGPAHQRLADYLQLEHGETLAQIRQELRCKTVDCSEILGHPVDFRHLTDCIRRGCELEWEIAFTEATIPAALGQASGS